MSEAFSPEQLQQLRQAFREELADAGLRLDNADHQDEARADFRFIRALRKGANGLASKLGWAIIFAVLSGLVWIFAQGLAFWNRGG
jgi:hypothetical protein